VACYIQFGGRVKDKSFTHKVCSYVILGTYLICAKNMRRDEEELWMIYHVKTITSVDQMEQCENFHIDHFQWTKSYKPKAYGKMAFIEDFGFVISMTAVEKDPLRTYMENDDPVYKDSGLEAFFNFATEQVDKCYLNFEMNANGALLSAFGDNINRIKLSQLTEICASCSAKIEEGSWSINLVIPMELICNLYHISPLHKGDSFTCNFYKISEDPSIEHYASFAPIDSLKPNFHLPEFFETAVIC
jgi:hypothetical protein